MDIYKKVEFYSSNIDSLLNEISYYLKSAIPGLLSYNFIESIHIDIFDESFRAILIERLDDNEIANL
jgi:hypothetical protein